MCRARAPTSRRSPRLRWIAILSALVPLSFILVQCGQAPSAGSLAANVQGTKGDTFDDRFPKPQFKDRFPTPGESLLQRQASTLRRARAGVRRSPARPLPGRVAGADRAVPASAPRRSDHAGQPEILGVSLFRQQSAHRRAVPERFQRRSPRPPQLRRPGLLAGRDLQRQPRPDACPGEFRHPTNPA